MDLIGIFAFALSGAFLAVRKDFDVFGTVILAEAAGLGGGLFRDLVIGVTPVAFTDLGYYLTPVAAALVVFFSSRVHRHVRFFTVFDVFDTAALAIFSITGTIKALSHGFGLVAAMTLGVASAVGGGVLSSVLAIEVPALLRWERDLYILPALAGAGAAALLNAAGVLNGATASGTAVAAFTLRLLAIRRHWHTPRAYVWRNPFSGMRHQPAPAEPGPVTAPWPPPVWGTGDTARIQTPAPFPEPRFPEDTVQIRLPGQWQDGVHGTSGGWESAPNTPGFTGPTSHEQGGRHF
jgi:uncharacterized membrane protein YeiH